VADAFNPFADVDFASEGDKDLRGAELDRLLTTLTEGGSTTLRGVLCAGGAEWRFTSAPQRRS
jgi:hypothetical protein